MNNEKYRTTKMAEGYNENTIKKLDELAALPPQDIPMSSAVWQITDARWKGSSKEVELTPFAVSTSCIRLKLRTNEKEKAQTMGGDLVLGLGRTQGLQGRGGPRLPPPHGGRLTVLLLRI